MIIAHLLWNNRRKRWVRETLIHGRDLYTIVDVEILKHDYSTPFVEQQEKEMGKGDIDTWKRSIYNSGCGDIET